MSLGQKPKYKVVVFFGSLPLCRFSMQNLLRYEGEETTEEGLGLMVIHSTKSQGSFLILLQDSLLMVGWAVVY